MSRRGLNYIRSKTRYGRRKCCWYCWVANVNRDFTEDHRQPRSRGGTDAFENKVPCCRRCNNLKSDMTEAEFREYVRLYGFAQPSDLRSIHGLSYNVVKASLRQTFQKQPNGADHDRQVDADHERLPHARADRPRGRDHNG